VAAEQCEGPEYRAVVAPGPGHVAAPFAVGGVFESKLGHRTDLLDKQIAIEGLPLGQSATAARRRTCRRPGGRGRGPWRSRQARQDRGVAGVRLERECGDLPFWSTRARGQFLETGDGLDEDRVGIFPRRDRLRLECLDVERVAHIGRPIKLVDHQRRTPKAAATSTPADQMTRTRLRLVEPRPQTATTRFGSGFAFAIAVVSLMDTL